MFPVHVTHQADIKVLLDVQLIGADRGLVVVIGAPYSDAIGKVGLHGSLQVQCGEVLDGGVSGGHLYREFGVVHKEALCFIT